MYGLYIPNTLLSQDQLSHLEEQMALLDGMKFTIPKDAVGDRARKCKSLHRFLFGGRYRRWDPSLDVVTGDQVGRKQCNLQVKLCRPESSDDHDDDDDDVGSMLKYDQVEKRPHYNEFFKLMFKECFMKVNYP